MYAVKFNYICMYVQCTLYVCVNVHVHVHACIFHTVCIFHVPTFSLLVYSSGLFPLLGYSSMSVRPTLLDIYERYYLSVGQGLVPCLPGMVLGLLPGLEDESEHTERCVLVCIHCICIHPNQPVIYKEKTELPMYIHVYMIKSINNNANSKWVLKYKKMYMYIQM